MKRLFIAVPIAEKSRNEIVRGILSDEYVKRLPVRWTAVQNLHLTLQFLGDVEEKHIPALKEILGKIEPPQTPEELLFSSVGAFPDTVRPRILWLGFENSNYLRKVQKELTVSLLENGFAADRKKFRPHLTLGRVRDNYPFPENGFSIFEKSAGSKVISSSSLDRLTLFESRLQPGGPVYTALYEKRLV